MKYEASKRSAMSILWAVVVLGLPGCDQGDAGETGAGGSTGMEMDGSSSGGGESTEDGSTGRPTPIPPADPDDDTGQDTGPALEDPTCEAYCDLYLDACQDYSEYANEQHCLDHCAQWPVGMVEDVGGDSLGCRTYHVTVAASTDAALHCPHAGPSGMHTCVDAEQPTCELYCTRYFGNCQGELDLWADMDECMSECSGWYPGTITDDHGHTTGCRAFYANLAAADAELHCPNAGPGGGEACVLGQ